jgi:hypothetical protein
MRFITKGNERMPIHLTIEATTVADLIHQLDVLAGRLKSPQLVSVPEELGVGDQKPTSSERPPGAGVDGAPSEPAQTEKPAVRRGRKPAADVAEEKLDRDKTIKELTEVYMRGEPAVRQKITSWRDGQGVSRLRDLKDESIADAARLVAELQAGP